NGQKSNRASSRRGAIARLWHGAPPVQPAGRTVADNARAIVRYNDLGLRKGLQNGNSDTQARGKAIRGDSRVRVSQTRRPGDDAQRLAAQASPHDATGSRRRCRGRSARAGAIDSAVGAEDRAEFGQTNGTGLISLAVVK